ncbi:MAG: type II secretion system protein [Phycisphaerae bacterium]
MTRSRRQYAGRRKPHSAAGFTLVELLVVMFIMSVIVALIVGVGKYVSDGAGTKQTRAAQAIVMRAIAAYHDQFKFYPDVDTTKKLTDALEESEDAWKIMTGMGQDHFSGAGGMLTDGFGNEMRYKPKGGFGDRPVLISAGPDGVFGEDDDDKGGDDIYSDKDK